MRDVNPEKLTRTERMHWGYAIDAMKMVEHDLMGHLRQIKAIPTEWHEIWQGEDRRDAKRVKVTANFDADVVKFFKAMGPGYQHRMNRVLRAFMHFRLAKLIEGPDTTDFVLRPDKVLAEADKVPRWGDMERWVKGVETRQAEAEKREKQPWNVDGDKFGGPKGRAVER